MEDCKWRPDTDVRKKKKADEHCNTAQRVLKTDNQTKNCSETRQDLTAA